MKIFEQIDRLQRIDQLIRMESTGCPQELANKLDISVSTLYELLNCLKQFGAKIYYNRVKISYAYEEPTELIFKLEKKKLSKVIGGLKTTPEKSEYFNLILSEYY